MPSASEIARFRGHNPRSVLRPAWQHLAKAGHIDLVDHLDPIGFLSDAGSLDATVVGTLIGALIIQLLHFTLLSHNVSDAVARVVTAAAIIVAVLIQRQGRA